MSSMKLKKLSIIALSAVTSICLVLALCVLGDAQECVEDCCEHDHDREESSDTDCGCTNCFSSNPAIYSVIEMNSFIDKPQNTIHPSLTLPGDDNWVPPIDHPPENFS